MDKGAPGRAAGGVPGDGVPALSVRNLTIRLGGPPLTVLDRVSLDVREGEFLLLAGSNGSGKTLLMRCMAGLLEAQEGEILLRGRPLSRARSLRRELGLVFQDAEAQLLGETVEEDAAFGPENLGFSREETARRAGAALEAVGLGDKRKRPPRRLSGGEKRRLAVAGVLAMGCGIIIMDEPFANLDWPGVVQVLEILASLKRAGKTLVVLTHELEKVLALADRLAILHQGRIQDQGGPAAVLDRLDPAWGVRDPRRNYQNLADCSWLPVPGS